MKNRPLLFLLLTCQLCSAQLIQTLESSTRNCWVINSSLNLPAAKFHLADRKNLRDSSKDAKGHLELFSSFGIGLSLNYGEAIFKRDLETGNLINGETDFTNLIGLQFGVLYSSKISEDEDNNINEFSLYGGVNILDIQVGIGYEYGARRYDATRWFVSIAYGIPIYKLTGKGSHVIKRKVLEG